MFWGNNYSEAEQNLLPGGKRGSFNWSSVALELVEGLDVDDGSEFKNYSVKIWTVIKIPRVILKHFLT